MKDLLSLRLFTRVARLGSISAAARDCGLSQSQASRIVAELEASLGARLLSRTTRAVVPTEAGRDFLVRAEAILDAVEDAKNSVREDGELRGMLRISMPGTIGYRKVIPRLAGFLALHPHLRVDVVLADQRQDLVRDAVDVSIRMGKLTDSAATAKLLASVPRVVLAARSYIERAGLPATPADLAYHRIIGGPSGTSWTFERNGEVVTLELKPHVTVNDNEGVVVAAISGLGICWTAMRTTRQEVTDGSLIEVLPDWTRPAVDIHAYFPMGRSTRRAARALVTYLQAEFSRDNPAPI